MENNDFLRQSWQNWELPGGRMFFPLFSTGPQLAHCKFIQTESNQSFAFNLPDAETILQSSWRHISSKKNIQFNIPAQTWHKYVSIVNLANRSVQLEKRSCWTALVINISISDFFWVSRRWKNVPKISQSAWQNALFWEELLYCRVDKCFALVNKFIETHSLSKAGSSFHMSHLDEPQACDKSKTAISEAGENPKMLAPK